MLNTSEVENEKLLRIDLGELTMLKGAMLELEVKTEKK